MAKEKESIFKGIIIGVLVSAVTYTALSIVKTIFEEEPWGGGEIFSDVDNLETRMETVEYEIDQIHREGASW